MVLFFHPGLFLLKRIGGFRHFWGSRKKTNILLLEKHFAYFFVISILLLMASFSFCTLILICVYSDEKVEPEICFSPIDIFLISFDGLLVKCLSKTMRIIGQLNKSHNASGFKPFCSLGTSLML